MTEKLLKRKTIRLVGFDYGRAGYYFVTICTQGKRHLFWETVRTDTAQSHVGAAIGRSYQPVLTPLGQIVENVIRELPVHYPNVQVDKSMVMPNHIHAIIILKGGGGAAPTQDLSTIINQMKEIASKRAGVSLWQKSYYDHIIRSEDDYLRIWNYIDTNPVKWTEDEYYTE